MWRPDWADTEPDPIPVPTIAWLTWHIDCPRKREVPPGGRRPSTTSPGDGTATVCGLRTLADRWRDVLTAVDRAEFP